MYLTAINTKEVLWQEDSIIRMINIDQHCFSDSGWFRVLNDWNYTQPYSNSRDSQYEPFKISLLFGYEIGVILPGLLRITEHKSNSLLVSHVQLASMIPIECHKTTFSDICWIVEHKSNRFFQYSILPHHNPIESSFLQHLVDHFNHFNQIAIQ